MSNDKLKQSFIKEILRISSLSDKCTQQNYTDNQGTGYSLANLKFKLDMNFNELKEAAGLKINNIGSHRKTVKKVLTGEIKECNRCLKDFRRVKKEFICPKCRLINSNTSERYLYEQDAI